MHRVILRYEWNWKELRDRLIMYQNTGFARSPRGIAVQPLCFGTGYWPVHPTMCPRIRPWFPGTSGGPATLTYRSVLTRARAL